jgi:phosphatidylglycerol:prolipoprotein diacylglycerol transferase
VQPEIDIFGFELKTFGLMFALNFVAWGAIASRRLKEIGKPQDWAWELVMVALAGGFIGARLYWIAQNWDEAQDDLLGSVFAGSGLIWYGGLAGGALAVYVWAKRRRFWTPQLLDFTAVGLPIGYAIGRIGCQLSGDGDYGGASSLPWAMPFPDGTVRRPTRCTRRRCTRRSSWARPGSCCGRSATACVPACCSRSTS